MSEWELLLKQLLPRLAGMLPRMRNPLFLLQLTSLWFCGHSICRFSVDNQLTTSWTRTCQRYGPSWDEWQLDHIFERVLWFGISLHFCGCLRIECVDVQFTFFCDSICIIHTGSRCWCCRTIHSSEDEYVIDTYLDRDYNIQASTYRQLTYTALGVCTCSTTNIEWLHGKTINLSIYHYYFVPSDCYSLTKLSPFL